MSSYTAIKYHVQEIKDIDKAIENYSFLPEYVPELDIDWFQYWREVCTWDRNSISFKQRLKEAYELNKYGIWALNGFTIHGSEEWGHNGKIIKSYEQKIKDVEHEINLIKKGVF